MTGPEHYLASEKILATLGVMSHGELMAGMEDGSVAYVIGSAQIHASLALTAATALRANPGGMPLEDHNAWYEVASAR